MLRTQKEQAIDFNGANWLAAFDKELKSGDETSIRSFVEYASGFKDPEFIMAVKAGYEETLKVLEREKGYLDAMDLVDKTVFMVAIRAGYESVLEILSKQKGVQKYFEVLEVIKQGGIDLNAVDLFGDSAFMTAIKAGNEKVVEVLSEQKGIDPNIVNYFGDDALSLALSGENKDIFRHVVEKDGTKLNREYKDGNTILLLVVDLDDTSFFDVLIERPGIDINARNSKGETPLIKAVKNCNEYFVRSLAEKSGIDFYMQELPGDDISVPLVGNSALSLAVENGYESVFRILVENGADLNKKRYGFAPIFTFRGFDKKCYGISKVLMPKLGGLNEEGKKYFLACAIINKHDGLAAHALKNDASLFSLDYPHMRECIDGGVCSNALSSLDDAKRSEVLDERSWFGYIAEKGFQIVLPVLATLTVSYVLKNFITPFYRGNLIDIEFDNGQYWIPGVNAIYNMRFWEPLVYKYGMSVDTHDYKAILTLFHHAYDIGFIPDIVRGDVAPFLGGIGNPMHLAGPTYIWEKALDYKKVILLSMITTAVSYVYYYHILPRIDFSVVSRLGNIKLVVGWVRSYAEWVEFYVISVASKGHEILDGVVGAAAAISGGYERKENYVTMEKKDDEFK